MLVKFTKLENRTQAHIENVTDVVVTHVPTVEESATHDPLTPKGRRPVTY